MNRYVRSHRITHQNHDVMEAPSARFHNGGWCVVLDDTIAVTGVRGRVWKLSGMWKKCRGLLQKNILLGVCRMSLLFYL